MLGARIHIALGIEFVIPFNILLVNGLCMLYSPRAWFALPNKKLSCE
jgi:hypothetical protein